MSVKAVDAVLSRRFGSPARKAVMLILADRADEAWSCYPGQERIALETELGERTVRRALAELEDMGVIARERRDVGGRRTSDRYYLSQEAIGDLPASVSGSQPATVAASQLATNDIPYRPQRPNLPATAAREPSVREPSVEPNTPVASLGMFDGVEFLPIDTSPLDGFNRFWQAYSRVRKVGKAEAAKVWPRAVAKTRNAQTIIEAAEALAAWPHLPQLSYRAHATTWLNRERWGDDLAEAYPPKSGGVPTLDEVQAEIRRREACGEL